VSLIDPQAAFGKLWLKLPCICEITHRDDPAVYRYSRHGNSINTIHIHIFNAERQYTSIQSKL
jgi:hypothetical protein